MTVSKPPMHLRQILRRLRFVIIVSLLAAFAMPALGQDTAVYVRLHLRDKGVASRVISRDDSLWAQATAHLTARALARRSKVLPSERLVTTDDLPIPPRFLSDIASAGAEIVQTSRWLNTVMVKADSSATARLRQLPFVATADVVRARRDDRSALTKQLQLPHLESIATPPLQYQPYDCITEHYGYADFQNNFMGIDEAHRIGVAGEGVLIGVLDAGFDWRSHRAFARTNVVDEYDFIYKNKNTADEPEDTAAVDGLQEDHGTMVLSLIGATLRDTLVGGAPNAMFMLAKTEDLRFERNVEEDNLVAGLEWLEAGGADITNTSLGYTGFDAPERSHTYEELDGQTAFASRGVNRAASLGVVCVVAAGNDGRPGRFVYTSVPAEADSSIAVAAVDSNGRVAQFSSRGFPNAMPPKPDLAGYGVGNWAAIPTGNGGRFLRSQGTSFASPMTAAIAALVLSAAPELRPWELRDVLVRSASQFASHDTALGYGIAHAGRALRELARRRIVVGRPIMTYGLTASRTFDVAAYTMDYRTVAVARVDSSLVARIVFSDGSSISSREAEPTDGIARWSFALPNGLQPTYIEVLSASEQTVLRRDSIDADAYGVGPTLCALPMLVTEETVGGVAIHPNPFSRHAWISFVSGVERRVTLTVHNARGEEVARLLDDRSMPAGNHTEAFDPSGLASGSYYVRVVFDDGAETRNGAMIYIRNP